MSFKYFNVKNGLTTGNIALHAANANVQANYFLGNINVTSSANLGAVGNIKITGGTSGYVLQTDGLGNLSWTAQSGGGSSSNISNGNSNVNIPSANGNINLTAVGNTTLVITGTGANIAGTLNVTNDAILGNSVTANYFTGNLYGTANLATYATTANSVVGANVSGQVGNSLVAGTVYTAAQPNITSVGTLSSLTATGNITGGNLTTAGVLAVSGTGQSSIAGNLTMNSKNIVSLADPVNAQDAATKNYVDTVAQGLDVKSSVVAATTGTLATASSGTVSYDNGTSGVGATLTTTGTYTTIDSVSIATVGARVLVKNEANAAWNGIYTYTSSTVLTRSTDFDVNTEMSSAFTFVEGGTTQADTGWVCTTNNPITVGTTNINFSQFSGAGSYSAGTGLTLTGSTFSVNASQPQITSVGTLTSLSVTGNITAGNASLGNAVTANYFIGNLYGTANLATYATTANSVAGANVSGQVANALVAGTVYTNAQPNITSVGTLSNLNVTGNITAGNISAGSGTGGSISGANLITANYFTGTLTTNAQPNITSVGTLTSLTVTGNITAGNASLGNSVTANYFTGNFYGTANLATYATTANSVAGANVSGQVGNSLVAGTVYTNAQPNITSTGSLTGLTVSNATGVVNFTTTANVTLGNVSNLHISGGTNAYVLSTDGAGNLSWVAQSSGGASNISNGNSNVNIPSANGNINLTAVGNTTMVVTGTGANIAGTLNVTGNATVGNLITSGSGGNISNVNVVSANTFTASGNITAGNANLGNAVTANYFIGNLYGTANSAGNATTAGTVTTNAQPNITSTGSLTGLTVSNSTGVVNFTTTANVTLGAVANLHISGGTNAYVLSTDGAGNLSWVAQSGGGGGGSNIANGNSNVTIPSANGNVNISSAGNANIVVVTGTGANIAGTLNVTGNATVGNLITSGSGGNISNVNVVSANTFTASGNITAGNANLGNSVTANYFIGNLYGTANLATYATTANAVAGANVSGQVANALVAGTVYTNAQPNITSVGTLSSLTVTGNITAGNISAGSGTGGSISGANLITANYFTGTLTTNAQPNITSVGTLTSLVVTGNITAGNANLGNAVTANYFIGNLYGTANLATYATTANSVAGANVSGQVGNSLVAGTVTTNAQPNITSTGSLTGLTVSNATGVVNFTTTANVTLGAVANLHISGGTSGQYLQTDGAGNLSWASVSSAVSNISNGNSNVSIPSSNGNINLTAVGNTTMVVTGTGANIAGTLNTTGNITGGGELNISGNSVIGGNLTVNGTLTYINSTTLSISDPIINLQTGANGAAPVANSGKDVGTALNYYDTSAKIAWMGWDVSNAEIAFGSNVGIASEVVTFTSLANIRSGNASLGNAVTANYFTGTLTTSAQPNITSTGSLTGLTVSNSTGVVDFTTTANVTLGSVGNLHISGGTNAYVLSTDGAGNLSWVAQTGGGGGGGSNIANGNSNVNIATANGNITMSAVGNANVVVVTGTGVNVAGTLNTTGNVTFGGANVSLGNVSNLHIAGGSNTYVLSTDGAGNLSWTQASGTSIGVDNFTGNGVQTAYTLSTTPANVNATLVSIAGTFQPRTVYSLAGNVITFSSAPPNTAPIEVTTFTAGNGGGGGGGITAQDLLSPFLLMGA